MRVFKMLYLAFSIPKMYNLDKNPYLDTLEKSNPYKSNYLDRLKPRARIPITIKLPLMIKNGTLGDSFSGPARRPKKSISSSEGTFRIEENEKNITFGSVGGYREVKRELLQVMDILKNKTKYEEFGIRLPRGVLLEGPTGNGKTLMARAFAGEIDYPIIPTSGAEFNEKYVGVGAARVRELFSFAEENEPCIIFVDEIDAVARKRVNSEDGAGDERSQTLNQLLVALDGFNIKSNVIVMGATNRIDILDAAVIRPGRMDKIIHVPNPDAETREEILNIHRIQKPLNVTTEEMVDLTSGMNGAQIENMLNEATLFGIRRGELPISYKILEETRNKIILGQSIGKKNISEGTMKRVAIHEIGHLLMALNSTQFDRPSKVTIDSSVFTSIGYTVFEQKDVDQGFYLREYCHDHLKVLLGGRVAEETIYGTSVSSGALSDLETAFQVAKKMIMEYGMGTHIIYPHFSETYRKRIDQEIHHLINNAYLETKVYLKENKDLLIKIADELMEKKTLYPKDFLL